MEVNEAGGAVTESAQVDVPFPTVGTVVSKEADGAREPIRDPSIEEAKGATDEKIPVPDAPVVPAVPKEASQEPTAAQRRAVDYGFSSDEIKALGVDAVLEAAMAAVDRRMVQLAVPVAVKRDVPVPQVPDFELNLPSEIDPDIKSAVEGMHGYWGSKFAQQDQMIQHLLGVESDRHQERIESEFNKALKGMGEAYSDCDAAKVWNEGFRVLEKAYRENGMKVPDIEELTKRATRLVYSDKSAEVARKQVTEEVEKRNKMAIGRPKARQGVAPDVDPDSRALRAIEAKLKAFGVTA